LWGQGKAPTNIKPFTVHAGLPGAVIAAVDLVRGIAKLAKMHLVEVEGATGFIDTNYAGKGEAVLRALGEYPFLFLHLEAPDEAGHMGSLEEKIRAIERFDAEIVGRVLDFARRAGDIRIVATSDHATPFALKTHAPGAVPFALWDPRMTRSNKHAVKFCEASAKASSVRYPSGPALFFRLLDRNGLADS
jgi:2,3-bisphosphoglycerate-independent phosphoglycerate mutase